jgi:hypothetical protein
MRPQHLSIVSLFPLLLALAGPPPSAAATAKKAAPPPRWTVRETDYLKEITPRLKQLPDGDPRKLLLKYFEYLQEPTADHAQAFCHGLLDARDKAKAPLTGVGIFSGDRSLCRNTKGECGFSIGSLSDRHFAPLLRQGDPSAIEIALTRFLVAAPDQAEMLSYFADFRVPKVVTRHTKEVLGVLHQMRDRLAELNPGPACYQLRFFDKKITESLIRENLPGQPGEELIAACQPKPSPSPSTSPAPAVSPSPSKP